MSNLEIVRPGKVEYKEVQGDQLGTQDGRVKIKKDTATIEGVGDKQRQLEMENKWNIENDRDTYLHLLYTREKEIYQQGIRQKIKKKRVRIISAR